MTFPQRQGGLANPSLGQIGRSSAAVVGYFRKYSRGEESHFNSTCRFCKRDEKHYGCWEEEALSYGKCVGGGGIFYNAALDHSNEYKCEQFRSFGHMQQGIGSDCGGRVFQK